MTKVSVIVPIYNESESLNQLYSEISEHVLALDYDFELVFVDDGSTDDTLKKLKTLSVQSNKQIEIKIFSSERNLGKTCALAMGIAHSKGEFLIFIDGDLQDDPENFKLFLEKLKSDEADIVCGNRVNRYQNNFAKRISSRMASILVGVLVGREINDINCSMKAMRREVAISLNLKSDYHRYIPLLAIMNGYIYAEIQINQRSRMFGKSKYGNFGLVRFSKSLLDYLSLWFIAKFGETPFGLFGKSGFIMFAMGLLVLSYLSVRWFFGFYILGRPLFFLGILFVNTGINFIALGLLGELVVNTKIGNGVHKSESYHEI